MSSRRINTTLALCLAGGLAAGIALARPAGNDSAPPARAEAPAAVATGDDDGSAYEYPTEAQGDTQLADPADDAPEAPTRDESSRRGPASADGAVPATITIAEFAFGDPITIAPGAQITVTNLDGAPHTVSAVDGSFDSGNLNQGDSAVITAPASPGTYAFFCAIHPSMLGELVVS